MNVSVLVRVLLGVAACLATVGCGQADSQPSGFGAMTTSGSGSGGASVGNGGDGARGGGSGAPGAGTGTDASADSGAKRDATSGSSSSGGGMGGSSGSSSGMVGAGDGGGSGGSSGGTTGSSGSSSGSSSGGGCGVGDPNLPSEPTIPSACSTLQASQNVATGAVPAEGAFDTSTIQAALDACASGSAVRLTTGGGNNAFITGPLTIPSGVTLWVDSGVTLYGTRDPSVYGSAGALITASGSNSGIVGDGVIDGQGGEPMVGSTLSFWDQNGSGGASPALVAVRGAMNFTLYRITLHDSPMFHVKLDAAGFVVWGVTIKAPSKPTNSLGTPLTYSSAHNTDGIDPGEAASNGFIVCSQIDVGDDDIAIKGSSPTGVTHLTIAHNHFEAGHGMSIGSEFTGGVSEVSVYDLSIDGMNAGTSGGSSNGIRIKSDSSRGGLVNNVTYSDVCVRNLSNPIILTPRYSSATGMSIPQYTGITIQNFHAVAGGSNTPKVTLDGFDANHPNGITLDNVIIDGISPANVTASYTDVTLGPGDVNFTPSGIGVSVTNNISGSSQPNPCTGKWVNF